jgi:VIT1/CCC1 family predicted Fe2+/Mn2+ transporter
MKKIDASLMKLIVNSQRREITENIIYSKLAASAKEQKNSIVLKHIAEDELRHYNFWKKYTNRDVKPYLFLVWRYYLLSRILGFTFGIKLMERGEGDAQEKYSKLTKIIPEVKEMFKDEEAHEKELIGLLHEDKLHYVGSIVLGLNDALVELTGALAGLTFALANGQVVALAGLITGIAASLSMGASEFQSRRSEKEEFRNAMKASVYTAITYFVTVILLILPYLLSTNVYLALGCTLATAIIIILIFTFYTSIAQDLPFRRRFLEMSIISLGVAAISFGIGVVVKMVWGI